jgi:hypothetical protein
MRGMTNALLSTVIVVDWPLIRAWYYHLWDEERWVVAQDQAEYEEAALEMDMMHEAGGRFTRHQPLCHLPPGRPLSPEEVMEDHITFITPMGEDQYFSRNIELAHTAIDKAF